MGIGLVVTFVLLACVMGLLSRQVVTTNSEPTQSEQAQSVPEVKEGNTQANTKATNEDLILSDQAQAQ
ncbi:hypothetical protein C7445_10456 [Alicyclobacillus sacchari]|uniref:Uncharacterized protein n=1 Tax=Alicyclobacillus sacchari TaxID=392010 RepID=A0A4R8LS20_9BACL|nr:hypothetical protein [Alicyclobacillus sacchari]TDY49545.1 hypothetical protein C7445_10456 [Alicyclobacillus sacchari]GMA58598.1 hypothetical protein GCM10025858_31010 [Alicyclobacillus sacchari]